MLFIYPLDIYGSLERRRLFYLHSTSFNKKKPLLLSHLKAKGVVL